MTTNWMRLLHVRERIISEYLFRPWPSFGHFVGVGREEMARQQTCGEALVETTDKIPVFHPAEISHSLEHNLLWASAYIGMKTYIDFFQLLFWAGESDPRSESDAWNHALISFNFVPERLLFLDTSTRTLERAVTTYNEYNHHTEEMAKCYLEDPASKEW